MERHLDEELRHLKETLLRMSGLVEEAISGAVKALVERNETLARKVVSADDAIDMLEVEVDEVCLRLIALHQPQARDLRFIASSMKINNDLERMGDLSVNIAQEALALVNIPQGKTLADIPRMANLAQQMLKDSINAFVTNDVTMARNVCLRDDEVDKLNHQIFADMLVHMAQDAKNITRAVDLILVTRNLERIADHATNIAEDVIYIVDGKVIKHHLTDSSVNDPRD
jgi:phosphate transport system protein